MPPIAFSNKKFPSPTAMSYLILYFCANSLTSSSLLSSSKTATMFSSFLNFSLRLFKDGISALQGGHQVAKNT